MTIKKLNVYVIHAQYLLERRKVIDELKTIMAKYTFSRLKVNEISIMTKSDPSDIENLETIVNYTPIQTADENLKMYNNFLRVLHINNLSNALKHFEALTRISQCTDPDIIHLVVEDDVMFQPRTCMLLDKCIEKIGDTQILFLGMPNNEAIKNHNSLQIKSSKEVFNILPYNDSYIITPNLASELVKRFLPIKFVTNIHLSYLLESIGVPIYQTVPHLFMDGSKLGMYLSSQVVNNDLIFNHDYMYLKSLLTKDPSPDEKSLAEKIISQSQIASNPDFLAIVGKYTRDIKKDYKKARDIYQTVFDIYEKNGVIMNNHSLFLRDFISLHAHLQDA